MTYSKMVLLLLPVGIFLLASCSSKNSNNMNNMTNIVASNQTSTAVVFAKPRVVANFPDYIEQLKQYAKDNGISDKTINIAFDDVYYVEHVVQADKNQPEKKLTLDEYLARALSPARMQLAQEKYLQYHSQLSNATRLTNVPQPYILALWGVESGYGRYQGKEDIISALATLSFDGRREVFFNKELLAALTILDLNTIKKSNFKGSWAGAMGQNQFIPSSYLAYGLDGDNDGVIDIWHNIADVFASTGNYLATVGWDATQTWGYKVRVPNHLDSALEGLAEDKAKTVAQWSALGIVSVDQNNPSVKTHDKMWLITPDLNTGYGYLVSNNFKTLMHWNRSYNFAVSIGMLAESLTQNSLTTSIK